MDILSIVHETKSRYSYIYKDDKLHLRLKTGKGQVKSVVVKAGDQFADIKSGETVKTIEMILEAQTRHYDIWFAEVSGILSLRIKYAFFITDISDAKYIMNALGVYEYKGKFKPLQNTNDFFNYPCLNPEDVYVAPKWSENTIWYQLTPSCYSDNGNQAKDNISGNLQGLIKKLDYIKDLGCEVIYMTPVFEARAWHLYDTIDYYKIDPRLGTNEEMKLLIDTAHKLGLKIVLDGVFNHCGHRHPFWKDVLKNGLNSKYYECFCTLDKNKPLFEGTFSSEEEYLSKNARDYNFATFAYTLHMPKLNFSSQIIRDYVLDIGEHWIKEYDIDGWRLDVSNEVSHEFWREFRKRIKAVKPEAILLGENWDDSYPWLMGDQFDSVMNYGIMNAIRKYLNPKHKSFLAQDFMFEVNELTTKYPKNVTNQLFNIVSSHDVDRILTELGFKTDLVKLAYLLLLTYSGSPCIYYGDEVGIAGVEQQNRVTMIFDSDKQDTDLLEFIKKLIKIRKSTTAFNQININWILADDCNNLLIYNKENYYILINNNSKANVIKLPETLANLKIIDCINDNEIKLENTLNLPAFGYAIYRI